MRAESAVESIGGVVERRRRRSFVGRTSELELVRSALDGEHPHPALLWVHGPAGIGKSSLVAQVGHLASDRGALVVALDGREVPPRREEVLAALRRQVEVPERGVIDDRDGRRLVLLVDGFEQLAALDEWWRAELLPRLGASSLVVVAGREPPGPAWRVDPGWRSLLRVVTLRNLEPSECLELLDERGVPEQQRRRLAEVSHGHPLALALLADATQRGAALDADPLHPDVVRDLMSRFVESVPDGSDRRVLGAAALARVTTESLLRDVVGAASEAGFAWLRELSFVEPVGDGLALHDLARDVLEADLRWRDPSTHADVFRAVRDHVAGAVTSCRGAAQRRAIHDLKYLFRVIPGVLSPVDWEGWGAAAPEPARPDDRDEVLGLIARHEGEESARIGARWWEAQPQAFTVVRDDGGVRGVIALVDLTEAPSTVRDGDPGARAAWRHVQRTSPPRPGEHVTQTRFVVDRARHQQPSPTLNLVPVLTLQRYLELPELAWDLLALADPDPWDEYFAIADLPRVADGDFEVGGRRFGLFAHDFRQVPVEALITRWTDRALARGDRAEPDPPTRQVLVLSHTEFREAVRQALNDLGRPELLERNILCRTRLAREAAGADAEPDAGTVESLVAEGIDSLRRDPRDDKRLRAIERTYLTPVRSQEAAAEVLGLPSSTYRRHLSQGVDRIVALLWDQEVHGHGG